MTVESVPEQSLDPSVILGQITSYLCLTVLILKWDDTSTCIDALDNSPEYLACCLGSSIFINIRDMVFRLGG